MQNKRLRISSYPVYHSLHDTYYWIKHFVDKDFTVHLTVARVVMSYLLRLADSLVLPFEVQRYAARLNRDAMEFQAKLKKEAKGKDIEELAGIYYWNSVLFVCLLEPRPVCLFVHPSVISFSQEWVISFFWFLDDVR